VGLINSLSTRALKRQSGGHIPGYGGGDRVPALLEQGEFVIPKRRVGQYGLTFLEAIRTGTLNAGQIGRYQSGGVVGSIGFGSEGGIIQTTVHGFVAPIVSVLNS